MQTFVLDGRWIAHDGEYIAFGSTKDEVEFAASHPHHDDVQDLVVRFSAEELELLIAFAQSLDTVEAKKIDYSSVTETRQGEPAPVDRHITPADLVDRGVYSILSPSGRKYGTWSIIRQSVRDPLI